MSVREWRKTPEGKKEMLKRVKEFQKNMVPELEKSIHQVKEAIKSANRPMEFIASRPASYFPQRGPTQFLEYRDGNFYAKDKLIDFPDQKSAYFYLLKALYFESDSEGFISYERIDKYIEKETKKLIKETTKKQKRILNALASLYRKREQRQKNPFPKKTSDGSLVIRNVPGKGLIFNNS